MWRCVQTCVRVTKKKKGVHNFRLCGCCMESRKALGFLRLQNELYLYFHPKSVLDRNKNNNYSSNMSSFIFYYNFFFPLSLSRTMFSYFHIGARGSPTRILCFLKMRIRSQYIKVGGTVVGWDKVVAEHGRCAGGWSVAGSGGSGGARRSGAGRGRGGGSSISAEQARKGSAVPM